MEPGRTRMEREAAYIFDLAEKKHLSLRTAAYLNGEERIACAISEQGACEYFQQAV